MGRLSPSALASVAGITALVGALKGMLGITKGMIEISKGFENVETGLKTVTGSGEKASKVFEQIRKLSYETTFGMEELGSAATMLLNSGETTGSINNQLLMLGNLASGDKQKFMDLTNIYSKILNLGKAGTEQIQMIALRGIPIQQTLRKIGVTGTASANDIKKAFEELTKEGGNFAGAMNNLNDTIAGREDFVSDTLKEIAVNFGELSGITDTYKSLLELVRNALDRVNNRLIELNKHPIVKALIGGTIAAGVTTLTVLIGVGLVAAIIKLNTQLAKTAILKAILDPKTLGIAAIIGGIAGISVAIAKVVSDAKDAKDAVNDMKPQTGSDWIDYNIENYQKKLEALTKTRDKIQKLIDRERNKLGITDFESYKKNPLTTAQRNQYGDEKGYELFAESQMKNADPHTVARLKFYQDRLDLTESQLELEKELREETDAYTKSVNLANAQVSNSMTSNEKKLKEALASFETVNKLLNDNKNGWNSRDLNGNQITLHLGEDVEAGLDRAGQRLKKTIEDSQIKVVMENTADWQQSLDKLLGLDSATVKKFNNLSGYFDKNGELTPGALAKINAKQQLYSSSGTFLVSEQSKRNVRSQFDYVQGFDSEQTYINNLVSALQKIRSSGEFNDGEGSAYKALQNQVRQELKSTVDFYQTGFSNLDKLDRIDVDGLKEGISKATTAYEQLLSAGIDPTTQYMIDFKNSIDVANAKLKLLNKNAQEILDNYYNPENKQDDSFSGTQSALLSNYQKNLGKANRLLESGGIPKSQISNFSSYVNELKNSFNGLVEIGIHTTTEAMKAMKSQVKDLQKKDWFAQNQDVVLGQLTNSFGELGKGFMALVTGGPLAAGIQILVDAFSEAVQSFDAINSFMDPIVSAFTELLQVLQPLWDCLAIIGDIAGTLIMTLEPLIEMNRIIFTVLKPIIALISAIIKIFAAPFMLLADMLGKVAEFLEKLFSPLYKLLGIEEEENEQKQEELERLKALNDQYKSLKEAIEEQEEYYLKKRREVNAQTYKDELVGNDYSTSVNDMILTPSGKFSTHPDDTIIAMKHPESLSSGASIKFTNVINNNASDVVQVATRQETDSNGNRVNIIEISRQIANDYADGSNGWDSAISYREQRLNGRRVIV